MPQMSQVLRERAIGFNCTGHMADMVSCGRAVCWCQQRYSDEIQRPIVVPFIHCHHLMFQHDNALPRLKDLCTIPGSWKCPGSSMACILTRHFTNGEIPMGYSGLKCTTACSSSRQYPATSHSHWRGVEQHSTINSLINYMQRRSHTAWGKWWSHQILTGFLIHYLYFKVSVTNRCISVFPVMWNP